VTLAEARDQAHECRRLLAQDIDPITHHRAERTKAIALSRTFMDVAEEYCERRRGRVTNSTIDNLWRSGLRRYVYPQIGHLPVNDIGAAEAAAVLLPIWGEGKVPVLAEELRRVSRRILAHAVANGYREEKRNPFDKEFIQDNAALPAIETFHKPRHYSALPWEQIGTFMQDLRPRQVHVRPGRAMPNLDYIKARVIEFLILTCVRPSNARAARWKDIDLEQRVWVIPGRDVSLGDHRGSRMKTKREHRVPLSSAAMALLEMQKGMDPEWVFPGLRSKGGPLCADVITRFLNTMGYTDAESEPIDAHGFRSTFRMWARAMGKHEFDVIELAIAHDDRTKTQKAYDRDDLLDQRRPLMEEWAQFIGKPYVPDEKVVPIRRVQGE
jgi:integrase